MRWTVFLEGFGMCAGLIVAIGAQNAYVLRLGLRHQHRFLAAIFCAVMDAILIGAGVLGLGGFINQIPILMRVVTGGGSLFLLWYGIRSLRAMRSPTVLEPDTGGPDDLQAGGSVVGVDTTRLVLASLAAFTLLNPHVWLDTVVLLGGVGARQPENLRGWFVLGACLASTFWFFALSYGAGLLAPLFRRQWTWRILDGVIALIMLVMAVQLALWAIGLKIA